MILVSRALSFSVHTERSCRFEIFGSFEVRARRGIESIELINNNDQFERIEVDDELLLESRWWNSNVGKDSKRLAGFLGWQNLDQRSRSKH